jgi:hypothetical protein
MEGFSFICAIFSELNRTLMMSLRVMKDIHIHCNSDWSGSSSDWSRSSSDWSGSSRIAGLDISWHLGKPQNMPICSNPESLIESPMNDCHEV